MTLSTRRSFLETTALAAGGLAGSSWARAAAAAGGSVLDRSGVALYTVRDLMKEPGPTLEDYCLGSTPLDSLRTSRANIGRLTAGPG